MLHVPACLGFSTKESSFSKTLRVVPGMCSFSRTRSKAAQDAQGKMLAALVKPMPGVGATEAGRESVRTIESEKASLFKSGPQGAQELPNRRKPKADFVIKTQRFYFFLKHCPYLPVLPSLSRTREETPPADGLCGSGSVESHQGSGNSRPTSCPRLPATGGDATSFPLATLGNHSELAK